jgi:hypothetical protein
MLLPLVLAVVPALTVQSADTARPVRKGGQPWHQDVAYDITARLDEPRGVLEGAQTIRYVNRSPDTLVTFALHLHLNAFRPGSRWSETDTRERRTRFQTLGDPDFAFNHVRNVRVDGEAARVEYPFAPDSTIARIRLPKPLAPGAALTATMDWDARPSTLPRRQGRRGRAFDFAHWYPKVVVYDRFGWNERPLVPAGEFYGEFATYDVTLDLPEDQVIGATGVPLCGDPGWAGANKGTAPVVLRRDAYDTPARPLSRRTACPSVASGRKSLVWHAEQVHHFAMSLNPEYRYEGGRFGDVQVHVLYQPGDEKTWGGGVAVKRTEIALAWLDGLFGKFAWPQLTNVHRIEGGGTEFPMMIHDGSADQGLIVHEIGHNYVMGHLANNEWREGWLDEGFTSFQTSWFFETATQGKARTYPSLEPRILEFDLDGISQPTSLKSDQYRDFATYNTMIYGRGELFFHQLRSIVGDETMRRILRTFFERYKLSHVDEAAFRAVAEEVSRRDLGAFFASFLHTTDPVDYAVGRVRRERTTAGWRAQVEVKRRGEGVFPVEVLVVGADGDSTRVRADGLAESETLEIATRSRPREVVIDPDVESHDWNQLNNYRRYFFRADDLLGGPGLRKQTFFDTHVSTPYTRDRLALGILPTAWYNDVGGLTLGLRTRESYLGRYEQNQFLVTRTTGGFLSGGGSDPDDVDVFVRLRNPVLLRTPNWSQTFEGFRVEGRYGATIRLDREKRDHLGFGPIRRASVGLRWFAVENPAYLLPGTHDDVGLVEAFWSAGVRDVRGRWTLDGQWGGRLGFAYDRGTPGVAGTVGDGYVGIEVTGTAKRPLGARGTFAARLYAGYVDAVDDGVAPQQRRVTIAGADPLQRFHNPFLRSTGALFVRPDLFYHLPGGAGLRGFDPSLANEGIVALNVEADRALLQRPRAKMLQRLAVAVFADAGHGFLDQATVPGGDLGFLMDAGVGVRAQWRIGQSSVTTRADFPLFVNRPELAQDINPGSNRVGFRWSFSFSPAF